jgi:transposase
LKIYKVDLTDLEREKLSGLISSGELTPRKIQRCKILLLFDGGKKIQDIVDELGVGYSTVQKVRKRYCEEGFELAVDGLPMGNIKKHQVFLTDSDRHWIKNMITKKELSDKEQRRCDILVLSDRGKLDEEIAMDLGVSVSAVSKTRIRYVKKGIEESVKGKPIPGPKHMLTKSQCQYIKDVALSVPPLGNDRWTLKLLAEKLVSERIVDQVSLDTIRRALIRAGLEKLS